MWLDWSKDTTAYVELPANPDSPTEWIADFWVEYAGREYLLEVPKEARAETAASAAPWELLSDGFESLDTERGRITPRWVWARRSLLLGLEQAHPYAVSARLQGGLKVACNKLLADWPESGQTLGDACSMPGARQYVLQCAIFHLVRIGKLKMDWTRGLSLNTKVEKVEHASQG